MADSKISGLDVDFSPATEDYILTVDVSDTSMAPSGTNKKVPIPNLPAIAIQKVTGLDAVLAGKASLDSPSLAGTPTGPTAASGTNTTQLATTAFVTSAVSGLGGVTLPIAQTDVTGLASALSAKAADSAVVHAAGNETIAGVKTFSSTIAGSISGTAGNVTGTVAIANGGTGQATATAALNALLPSQSTASGKFLQSDGTNASWQTAAGGGGSGTVTSVALTVPTGLAVTGSPLTTSGTLAITTALSGVLKGTGSGIAAATAGTDYLAPTGSGAGLSGVLLTANNLSDVVAATARTNLGLGTAATTAATAYATSSQGAKADSAVQSITLNTPNVLYATPITFAVTSGSATGTLALNAQSANTVFAGPTTGTAATPTMRALVSADLPTVGVTKGGTGLTTIASGKLLYASAADTLAPLTLGTNLSITGGTLNATGGAGGATVAATSSVLKGDGAGNGIAATAGTDYLTPSGSGASLTGITESQVTNLVSDLAAKAPLASPTFTGTVTTGTLNGLIKGTTGVLSAATAGTDYLAPSGDGSALTGVVHLTGAETVAGAKNFTSQMTLGTSSATSGVSINGPAASTRDIAFQTAGVNRWVVRADGTAEGGSNAGSDFAIRAFTDAGGGLGNWLAILRSNGTVTIGSASITQAGAFSGTGTAITGLNASNLAAGTVAVARRGTLLVTATDAATVTFDLSASVNQIVTLGGNRTLALSNVTVGHTFTLALKQDATGSRTISAWFSGISWPGGTVPTLTTTANKTDIFDFICTASGAYLGTIRGQNL